MEKILAVAGSFKDAGMIPHIHQSYSIGLFYEGEYRYKHGNKKAILKQGQMRIISPYEVHETFSGEWGYIHFDLNKETFSKYLSDIYQKEIDGIIKLKPLYKSNLIFNYGKELFYSLQGSQLEQEVALNRFLELILKHNKDIDNLKIDYSIKELNKAVEYILQNFHRNDLKIEEIAKVCNLSTYYFARSFKKHHNITLHQFIMSLRVENVKKLLKKGNLPLSQIALESGFSDQSHMIRVFKRITGKTPTWFG